MSKYAHCDLCGDKDDWSMSGVPFLPSGVVLQFRSDSGGDEFDTELEICEPCKTELLGANPKLAEAFKRKATP